MEKKTKQDYIKELIEWQGQTDTETAHGVADDVLCAFLRDLGHGDLVDEWEKVDKWYA